MNPAPPVTASLGLEYKFEVLAHDTFVRVDDEFHLPHEAPRQPSYLPHYRALDEILRRPSLDERVPRMLQPQFVDPDLMEPATLTETRLSTRRVLHRAAERLTGKRRKLLELAIEALAEDAE